MSEIHVSGVLVLLVQTVHVAAACIVGVFFGEARFVCGCSWLLCRSWSCQEQPPCSKVVSFDWCNQTRAFFEGIVARGRMR